MGAPNSYKSTVVECCNISISLETRGKRVNLKLCPLYRAVPIDHSTLHTREGGIILWRTPASPDDDETIVDRHGVCGSLCIIGVRINLKIFAYRKRLSCKSSSIYSQDDNDRRDHHVELYGLMYHFHSLPATVHAQVFLWDEVIRWR